MSVPTGDASTSTLDAQDTGLFVAPLDPDVSGKVTLLFRDSLTPLESLILQKPIQP